MNKKINYSESVKLLIFSFGYFFIFNFYIVSVDAKNSNLPIEINFEITENNTNIIKDKDNSDSYSIQSFEKNAFVYFHQNIKENFSKYEGIELNIENYSEEEIKFKLHLQNSLGEVVSCKDDSIVIFESNNMNIAKKIKDNYIVIPKNFSGKLLVPFTSLAKDETEEKMKSLNNIISIGITLETKYELEQKIKFSSLSAYTHNQTEMFLQADDIDVIGETSISIPKVGENIVKYQVTGNVEPVLFELIAHDDNIFVSSDGRLVVTNRAKSDDAILRIRLNNNLSLDLDINLENNDFYINIDGETVQITSPEEIKEKKSTRFYLKVRNNMNTIRVLLFFLTIAFIYLYFYWNNSSIKKNGKKEDN